MDARVLIYGCEKERKKIKTLCGQKNIQCRVVAEADYAQPIGALCGTEKRREDNPPVRAVPDMLVLAHFSDKQLDAFLAALRTARVGTAALKAALTPTNAAWDAATLAKELLRERSEMEG